VNQPLPFVDLDVEDEILVTTDRPMTLTWRLTGWHYTHFNSDQGIKFDNAGFRCQIDPNAPRVYTCTNTAAKGRHKYTIRTKGFGSPREKDPWVVNN